MIDTDKYEGHTEGPWKWSYSDDVAAQLLIIPNGNDGISNGVCIGLGDADAQLIADAPLILEAYKRLREVIDKEHPTFDWASRQTIANLEAEVKRLRDAMEQHGIDISFDPKHNEEDEAILYEWLDATSQGYWGSVYEYKVTKQEELE